MSMETKTIQVANDPGVINRVNEIEAAWGWNVMSVQITDHKIVHEGNTYGTISSYGISSTTEIITEHTNYATITYQRDKDDPQYVNRVKLEGAFYAAEEELFLTEEEQQAEERYLAHLEKGRSKLGGVVCIAAGIIGFIPLAAAGLDFVAGGLLVLGVLILNRSKILPAYRASQTQLDILQRKNRDRRVEKQAVIIQMAHELP